MAFKLTRAEEKDHQDLISRLREKQEAFEAMKAENVTNLPMALAEYMGVASEARDFRDSIVERWQGEYDDKSDKWREGDTASEVESIISEWESAELEDPDVEDLTEYSSLDLDDLAQVLEDLPTGV